jgi:hypothetical protein
MEDAVTPAAARHSVAPGPAAERAASPDTFFDTPLWVGAAGRGPDLVAVPRAARANHA